MEEPFIMSYKLVTAMCVIVQDFPTEETVVTVTLSERVKMSEAVISKIQKLLALAKSSNVHEAATASRKARELMLLHSLEMADLESEKNKDPFSDIVKKPFTDASPVYWKLVMWNALAEYCICKLCVNRAGQTCALGKKENTELFFELQHYVANTLHTHATAAKRLDKSIQVLSYKEGWAEGLRKLLKEMKEDNSQIRALIINQMTVLDEYTKQNLGAAKKETVSPKTERSHSFIKGFIKGQTVEIKQKV